MLLDLWARFGAAAIIFLAFSAIGFVVDQLLYRVLTSRFARSGWAAGATMAGALHGMPTGAGIVVGAWLAIERAGLHGVMAVKAGNGVRVAAIVVATAFGARLAGRLVRFYTERESTRLPASSIFVNLTRSIVWVLGIASVLAALGVSITPIITALGVGGLAVGLALQPTLENVFSGVQVLASRQIEPGDFIRLDTGEEGAVVDVTWRNTAIQRASGELVIVPNSVIGRSLVTNFSRGTIDWGMSIPVTVAYGADLDTVERIALEVAQNVIATVEGAVATEQPIVRFADLTPPTITFNTVIRVTSYPDRMLVRSEYIKRLHERLAEEGVEAPPAPGVVPPRPSA
jgi:small-conductance mechanosensitive channel